MAFKKYQISNFNGGLFDFFEPNEIESNQASWVKNCMIDTFGRLSPRKGQSLLYQFPSSIQGLHSFYHGDNLEYRRIMVASGGKIYYGNDSGSFSQIYSGFDTTENIDFLTTVNYLVMFNGKNTPIKWDGNTSNSPSVLSNAPVTGKFPVLHVERIFVAVDVDTIRWCEPFQIEDWPAVNYWDFDKGNGDEITGLAVSLGDLYVFKRYSIHRIVGSSMDDFRSDKLEKTYGAVCNRSIIVDDPYIYYVSDYGIMRWDGIQSTNLIESIIPNFWKRVNKQYIHKSCAIKDGVFIRFSIPIDCSTVPNCTLAYDTRFGSWWPWLNIKSNSFLSFYNGEEIKLFSGDNEGNLIQQGIGTDDIGEPIECEWVGAEFDDSSPSYRKKVKNVFVSDDQEHSEVEFNYKINGENEWQSPRVITDFYNVRRYSISKSFRYFQPRFYSNSTNEFAIRDFLAEYFRIKAF